MRWLAASVAAAAVATLVYAGYEAAEAPASQLFGATVVRGAPTRPEIALTFDDGPNPPYTTAILDVLRSERVPATFFVVGRAVEAYPDVVRRMVREGHAVGNHTWDHPHLIIDSRATIRAELERTSGAIARATGVRPTLMRPPFGVRDFGVVDEAKAEGYRVVMWSVPLPDDWEQPGDATIVRRVVSNVADGSIVVLHDGDRGLVCGAGGAPRRACDRSQDIAATREIVRILRRRGFRFVTVPRLLADAATGVTRTASR